MPTVAPEILEILSDAEVEGPLLTLTGTLDRKTYSAVDKVLTKAGGKWDRKAKGHVFDRDAEPVLRMILADGAVTDRRQEFGIFYTPQAVVDQVMGLAQLRPSELVLEPSFGGGALVRAILQTGASVTGYEIRDDPDVQAVSGPAGRAVLNWGTDFLTEPWVPKYDAVVMNPPFAYKADIAHVTHALAFLRPGGRLVSVMWPGWQTSAHKAAVLFREMVEGYEHEVVEVPAGSFAESGTDVATVILRIQT